MSDCYNCLYAMGIILWGISNGFKSSDKTVAVHYGPVYGYWLLVLKDIMEYWGNIILTENL